MNFRDFMSNRRYRNIKPPANPSRQYIDDLVNRLLDEGTAENAHKELAMIGPAAVPSLAAAIRDSRFQRVTWAEWSSVPAPLPAVLELLVPHGAEHVLAAAERLTDSLSAEVRKAVALELASLGRMEAVPLLARLLQDADGFVRSYVRIGIDRALRAGRASDDFRQQAYDLLIAQCDQSWEGTNNDAAETVIALDPKRAAEDFASARWLSYENRNVHVIIAACNRAGIVLPDALIRPLLDRALSLAVGPRCYPHEYLAAAALEALALRLGEQARPLLEEALNHEQEKIREGAARGIARLAGMADPISFVFRRAEEVGFDGLTNVQRVVYCAVVFDGEVCNGGIMQFFGNSSGDHAAETLDALRALGPGEAENALASAMEKVGPLACERNQEKRLAAFEGRYDELQAAFQPLEHAYYGTRGILRQKALLYAASHAEHFRSTGTGGSSAG